MPDRPLHLAIIPDGNRRWARGKGLLPWNGHEKAVGNFSGIIDWCRDNPRIGTLTMWCFSTENWKRDPEEVRKLMEIFENFLVKECDTLKERRVCLIHSGRTDRIPASLRMALEKAIAESDQDADFTLHLALDYGGKDEVVRAIRNLPDPAGVTEDILRAHLDHPELPDIDLIVRTSGEQRASNFFLWQGAYAEWFFLKKHFPELTSDDLEQAIEEFDGRKRRYGK